MSGLKDLDMTGRMPLVPRFPDILMYDPLEGGQHVEKKIGDHLVIKSIMFTKEATMAKVQASMEMSGDLPDSMLKKGIKIVIPFVKSLTGLWVSPELLPKKEEVIVEKKEPDIVMIVMPPTPEKETPAAPVAAAPVIQEEVVPVAKKTPPIDWQAFRNKWFPKVAGVLLLLLLLMIIGFCWSVMSNWLHKPVASQQQVFSGENPVTSMQQVLVTNNGLKPLPVWIDNDTKPRITLNPGDTYHVMHRGGERTRVKIGEKEEIFSYEGKPPVQNMTAE